MTFIMLMIVLLLLIYIVATVDDLLLDLIYLFRRKKIYGKGLKTQEILYGHPQKIAVMVGAWQEAGVVTPMISSTLEMMRYPVSQVDFFIGVYPNDLGTLSEVQELAKRVSNVHCVINEKPGPTSKSQNLNSVYQAIEAHECKHGKFDVISVHDAEDVIHPYTFSLYSVLLKKHSMVQLPVFALFPETNWRTYLKALVSGSYADEFAEQHLHHLPAREELGLFIPSAGTGFAMKRFVLHELYQDGDFLTEGALTEDYELALRLWRKGIKVHFHVQELPRVDYTGRIYSEVLAVKEYFPTDVKAAVKQKARWTYGITLQTPELMRDLKVNIIERLTLWHDQKGKFTNLVHLIGYPVALILTMGSLLGWNLFEHTSLTWGLSWFVLAMTYWRIGMRGLAVRRLYGNMQGLISTIVLPGLPLRWLIGNYINMLATLRAWRLYLFPEKGQKRGVARWDKTERKSYVPNTVLDMTRRRLGDILLMLGQMHSRDLAYALAEQRSGTGRLRLGEVLLEESLVEQDSLTRALAHSKGFSFIRLQPEMINDQYLSVDKAQHLRVVIMGQRGSHLLVATPDYAFPEKVDKVRQEILNLTGQEAILFAVTETDFQSVYQRPLKDESVYHKVLNDHSINPDMLEYEFQRLGNLEIHSDVLTRPKLPWWRLRKRAKAS